MCLNPEMNNRKKTRPLRHKHLAGGSRPAVNTYGWDAARLGRFVNFEKTNS
jgi:hypothetical protein